MEQIQFKIDVNTEQNATKTLGELRQEFRTLQKEVLETERGTDDYYKSLKRLGETKNDLDGMRQEIRLLAKDGLKTQAALRGFQGLAGAFSAAQGALALFNVDNEKLAETLVKVNAAMAISQGIDAFANSYRTLVPMLSVLLKTTPAINNATGATNRFSLAWKAMGIGLLISALAFLVTHWSEIKEKIDDLFPSLGGIDGLFKTVTATLQGTGKAILEWVIAPIKIAIALFTDGIKAAVQQAKESYNVVENFQQGFEQRRLQQAEQANLELLKETEKSLNREIQLRKARGQETEEVERQLLQTRLTLAKDNQEELEKIQLELELFEINVAQRKAVRLQTEEAERLRIIEENLQNELNLRNELDAEQQQIARELELRLMDEEQSAIERIKDNYAERLQLLSDNGRDTTELEKLMRLEIADIEERFNNQRIQQETQLKQAQLNKLREDMAEELSLVRERFSEEELLLLQQIENGLLHRNDFNMQMMELEILRLEQEISIRQQYGLSTTDMEAQLVNARIQLSDAETDAKLDNIQKVGSALGQASALIGKSTAFGKVAGVAQATVDTYVAANKALASAPPPFNAVLASGVVANGIANVRRISKTKIPQFDGQSTLSSPQVSVPQFNANPIQTTQTQLSEIDRELLNRPVVAQVVETEVTNVQRNVRNIERDGTF